MLDPIEVGGMEIRFSHCADTNRSLALVAGDVDIRNSDALKQALIQLMIWREGPIAVDLSKVGFFDSQGIRALTDALAYALGDEREFRVINPSDPANRALRHSPLSGYFFGAPA